MVQEVKALPYLWKETETETFTLISTLDTSAMLEAPEEVAKPGESQWNHR